jgi:hypothetical protein
VMDGIEAHRSGLATTVDSGGRSRPMTTQLGGRRRWSLVGGDPGWVVEAHRTGGLAREQRRRAVIGDLLVER